MKCGAWGCFDEFNRLEEATLSAVSTHIHIIQEALRSDVKNIVLMNKQVYFYYPIFMFHDFVIKIIVNLVFRKY